MTIVPTATGSRKHRTQERVRRSSRNGQLSAAALSELLSVPDAVDPLHAPLAAFDYRPRQLSDGPQIGTERYGVLSVTAGTLAFSFVNGAASGTKDERDLGRELDQLGADILEADADFTPEVVEGPLTWDAYCASNSRRIREWSAKSRVRMMRTVASLDLEPLTSSPHPLGMITLTLPGDWLTVAPTAAVWDQLVRKFLRRWARAFAVRDDFGKVVRLRPLVGIWKREFQRRGAPHLHILAPIPALVPVWEGRGRGRKLGDPERFELWLSRTWADVVAHPDPAEYAKHLAAGTGVDFSKSPYMLTGVDLARYFMKHSSKTGDDKEYQHIPPAEWVDGVGRYWGLWGLSAVTEATRLTEAEVYRVRRVVRRWDRANARHYKRPARRSLGFTGRMGAWVLVDDPVSFVQLVLAAAGVQPRAAVVGAPITPALRVPDSGVVNVAPEGAGRGRWGGPHADVRCSLCGHPVEQIYAAPPFAWAGIRRLHPMCVDS